MIYVYAGLQLLGLVAVYLILGLTKESIESKPAQPEENNGEVGPYSGKAVLFASVPHLKYVAILSAALVVSLTLIDYQFKVIMRGTLQNEALAGFMGSFYGFSGLIALLCSIVCFRACYYAIRRDDRACLIFPITLICREFWHSSTADTGYGGNCERKR